MAVSSKPAQGFHSLMALEGMENSCLTFATPSAIAGDRSSVDLAAHEISHVCLHLMTRIDKAYLDCAVLVWEWDWLCFVVSLLAQRGAHDLGFGVSLTCYLYYSGLDDLSRATGERYNIGYL